ncbi:MAG TPA: methyltransferase domain-containing protein [Chitinophaga sp.]
MKPNATESARMPAGASSVLDSRSLQNSYATLLPLLRPGMRVLDVGCGTGAITAGIAAAVGATGLVVGIDSSDHLIAKGRTDFAHIPNLRLEAADLFRYTPPEPFDLVVSARVLQWLSNPAAALEKCKSLLRPVAGSPSSITIIPRWNGMRRPRKACALSTPLSWHGGPPPAWTTPSAITCRICLLNWG